MRPLVVEGDVKNPTALVLIGRLGSGKSWLAQAIAKRRTLPTIVANQDVIGHAACERAAGRAGSLVPGTLFILDQCNPTSCEREEWGTQRGVRRAPGAQDRPPNDTGGEVCERAQADGR